MPLVLLNRRRRGGGGPAPAFSPSTLFALAEPGVWYDPSDLTTLFTDTAGTTPVTTPGNTVALMLDKSKGLELGAELVTNGTFPADTAGPTVTGWTAKDGAALSVSSGQLVVNANIPPATNSFGGCGTSMTLVSGRTYVISIQAVSKTTPQVDVLMREVFTGGTFFQSTIAVWGSPSNTTFIFRSSWTGTGWLVFQAVGAGTFTLDNISVRELPGFHATQATAASRPTYGVVPLGGRRNLFERAEELSNAYWTIKGSMATPTQSSGGWLMNDTNTGSFQGLDRTITNNPANNAFASIDVLKTTGAPTNYPLLQVVGIGGTIGPARGLIVNTTTGAVVQAYSDLALSPTVQDLGTFWRVSFGTSQTATSIRLDIFPAGSSDGSTISASATGSAVFNRAQLETGSTATAYQKVTTQYDVTEVGVQSLSYLSFDGVDDGMVTGTITPGVDKAQVFAGVRKSSDAAEAILIESSTALFSGTFRVYAPRGGAQNFSWRTGGTSYAEAASGTVTSVSVLSGTSDIASDSAILRVNGTQAASSASDQGTGNFLAYPLYIGRRGGSALPFKGNVYSLITRFGANLDAGVITNTETWVAGKTGISL